MLSFATNGYLSQEPRKGASLSWGSHTWLVRLSKVGEKLRADTETDGEITRGWRLISRLTWLVRILLHCAFGAYVSGHVSVCTSVHDS